MGIEINQKYQLAGLHKSGGEVHGRGGLGHPALLVGQGENACHLPCLPSNRAVGCKPRQVNSMSHRRGVSSRLLMGRTFR